jgi:hypothetical protein
MQRLYTAETVEIVTAIDAQIKAIGNTISFVDGVGDQSLIYDSKKASFVKMQITAENHDEALEEIRYTVTTIPETISTEICCSSANTMREVRQLAIIRLNQISADRFRIFRIGDPVEDILQLIYKNQDITDVHKVDMRWSCCCTLKNQALIDQALGFISAQPVGE